MSLRPHFFETVPLHLLGEQQFSSSLQMLSPSARELWLRNLLPEDFFAVDSKPEQLAFLLPVTTRPNKWRRGGIVAGALFRWLATREDRRLQIRTDH